MTLLAMESFDLGYVPPSLVSNSGSLSTSTKRTGVAAMAFTSGDSARFNITPSADVIFGAALRVGTSTSTITFLTFYGDAGTTEHIGLYYNDATPTLEVRRGATVLGSCAITEATWQYVEFRATIHDSTGIAQVWVDGVLGIDFVGDTRNGGTSTNIDQVRFTTIAGLSVYVDDMYVLNALGSVNNARLGDIDVVALRPNGAGTTTQLTPSTGANYTTVDDPSTVSTADYNSGSTAGLRDLYALEDAPATSVLVKAVKGTYYAGKQTTGAASLKPVTKANGTTKTDDTAVPLFVTAQGGKGVIQELDPTGAAWTVANLNAAEAGVETV